MSAEQIVWAHASTSSSTVRSPTVPSTTTSKNLLSLASEQSGRKGEPPRAGRGKVAEREREFEERVREQLRASGQVSLAELPNVLNYTMATPLAGVPAADDVPQYKHIGVLLVTVIGATGIKDKSPSPFVKLQFGNQRARTAVQKDTALPLWKQTFVFTVDNPNAVLQLVVKSENSVLKDSKLGQVHVPLHAVHCRQSTGARDEFRRSVPLLRHKKETAAALNLQIVYIYEPAWDFIALFENRQLVEESRRVPEADPEPDYSYLTAFRLLRSNLYRFLVAIVPFLELFLYVRDVLEWKSPPTTLLFLLVATYTLVHELFFTAALWCAAFFLAVKLLRRARDVFRSQPLTVSIIDRVVEADPDRMLDGMRAEVAPVLTRVRRGKPPDTILQDMVTLATIFQAIADASIAVRRLSAVSPLAHDGNTLAWISAERWRHEVTLIAACFAAGLLCLLLPVVPVSLFLLRYGALAALWYRLTWGHLADTYPRIATNFSPAWLWRQLVRALRPAFAALLARLKTRFPAAHDRLVRLLAALSAPTVSSPSPRLSTAPSDDIVFPHRPLTDLDSPRSASSSVLPSSLLSSSTASPPLHVVSSSSYSTPAFATTSSSSSSSSSSPPAASINIAASSSPVLSSVRHAADATRRQEIKPAMVEGDLVLASPSKERRHQRSRSMESLDVTAAELPPVDHDELAAELHTAPSPTFSQRSDSERTIGAPAAMLVLGQAGVKTVKHSLLQKRSSGLIKSWSPRLLVVLKELNTDAVYIQYYRTAEVKGQVVRETAPLAQHCLRDLLLIDVPGEKAGRPHAFVLTAHPSSAKEVNLCFACTDAKTKEDWLKTLSSGMLDKRSSSSN